MKRILCVSLALILLFIAQAAGEDPDYLKLTSGGRTYTLKIAGHGFEEGHKTYAVTVSGYSLLNDANLQPGADIQAAMPFNVAIAWNTGECMSPNAFRVTTDPVTTVYFEKEDGSIMEEPRYIIIAEKGKSILRGCYYVISEGIFRDVDEVREADPTPSPTPRPTQAPTPAPGPDAREQQDLLKTAGSYVTFGSYPQTTEGTDKTPIEWLVLEYDAETGSALLISRYGLDAKPFHAEKTDITWENCTLRAWLNGEFLQAAFTPEEQAAVLLTEVDNSSLQKKPSQNSNITGGNDTQDRVFLLSFRETFKVYFKNPEDRLCAATDYAVSQGAGTSTSAKQTVDDRPAAEWWTRSPGDEQDGMITAGYTGEYWGAGVDCADNCVRPVIRVDLNADFFASGK